MIFFKFQGLERHLLGSHGLVTASMQDLANKGMKNVCLCYLNFVFLTGFLSILALRGHSHIKLCSPRGEGVA